MKVRTKQKKQWYIHQYKKSPRKGWFFVILDSMKKKALIFVLMLVMLAGGWWYYRGVVAPAESEYSGIVRIAGKDVLVVLADTASKREQGLSGRQKLASGEGMLFVFEKPDIYSFWMKDMLFPIDIVWIDDQYGVVYIQKNADPRSYPDTFLPTLPAQYVLEVNAGFSEKNNLKVGDKVEINL